ncbi:hypothetical protein JCM8547_004961 [Rhodosporidiobolus lusitaniae]
MSTTDPSFSLTTSLSYSPSRSSEPFSLLPRHFSRLRTAHARLAKELPECWCARTAMPTDDEMQIELKWAVQEAKTKGNEGDLRIRLNITEAGEPFAETFPLVPMPSYPVRLVIVDRPTDYNDPFLRSKTTRREKYDEARARLGATLHPSPDPSAPPFDVVLFNSAGEVTETTIANIAFRFSSSSTDPFITPPSLSGLLEGVQRAELLEKGEIVERVVKVEEVNRAARAGQLEVICFNGVRGVFRASIFGENGI